MEGSLNEALERALRYLERQDRSCAQMARYLTKKGYEEETVAAAIEQLEAWGYLNDRRYAGAVAVSGVSGKNLGRRAVAQKLFVRGIDKTTAQEALDEACSEETERENALFWAKKLWPSIAAQDAEFRAKREKLSRRLAAKGFSYDVIRRAVERVTNADPWDEE